MSAAQPEPRQAQFVLSAAPPVRALAISAGLAVLGVLLVVLWSELKWPIGIGILGGLLCVLGVALGIASMVLTARAETVVQTDGEQISIRRAGQTKRMRWAEVGDVVLTGHRLTLRDRDGVRAVAVFNPRPHVHHPAFLAVMSEVQTRLDSDRGYSPFH